MEKLKPGVIVFDMDGVLVDVTESYRAAIADTVRQFSGHIISNADIQQYKNSGGWNNDWALSQRIIADVSGREVPYEDVVEYFNAVFLGTREEPGLIVRERWLPAPGLLERLVSRARLAIFTGRTRPELDPTLERFTPGFPWSAVLSDEDITEKKPHPEGLLRIAAIHPGRPMLYVGDTIDDARAAAAAGIAFVGIVHAANPRHDEAVRLLEEHNAVAVLSDVNEL
ncbi:MAG TPA: HAD-IA family hydrolase, partial [Bryobacteraceae bacterium]|nr:HAD-IA family hydrolase [Bryobacteraceae bacterium]